MATRKAIPQSVKVAVLTEAGYRCAVPTCRTILAIDLHHIVEVCDGGGNNIENLIALCPTCHALFHRGTIARDSTYVWKSVLVSLGQAFDLVALDQLLFLGVPEASKLYVSGDGVVSFSRLIAAGLASFALAASNGPLFVYRVSLTEKGESLLNAWKSGDRLAIRTILGSADKLASIENKAPPVETGGTVAGVWSTDQA